MSVATKQTTGGKVWDAARHLLDFLRAHADTYLLHGTHVMECGAGTGYLGMCIAHERNTLGRMLLTEMIDGGALEWLELNVSRNRAAGCELGRLETAAFDWAWCDSPNEPAASGVVDHAWDLVLGSDLVYNDVGVQMLPRVFARLLSARDGASALYAHTLGRFEFLDYEFHRSLDASGLQREQVWPEPSPDEAKADGSSAHDEQLPSKDGVDSEEDEGFGSFSGELFPEPRVVIYRLTLRTAAAHRTPGPTTIHTTIASSGVADETPEPPSVCG